MFQVSGGKTVDGGTLDLGVPTTLSTLAVGANGVIVGTLSKDPAAGTAIKSSKTRAANLSWATDVLEHAHKVDKDDIEATAYLAEAYAANPKTQDKAKTLLTGLAKDDLMADATGWATLAKLQHADGDTAGAKTSSKRCADIARDASMCKLPALEEAKAPEAKTAAKKS